MLMTVCGIYEDNHQRWCDTFVAETVESAIKQAPKGVLVAAVFIGNIDLIDQGTYAGDPN